MTTNKPKPEVVAWMKPAPPTMTAPNVTAAPDAATPEMVAALEAACEHHLPIGSRALELASIALAAHRKGGEK